MNLDLCFIIVRLPAWASRYFNTEKFKYCLTYHLFDAFDRTPEMARLSGGFLLPDIINFFKSVKNGTNSQRALHLYAGHDNIIAGMISALGFQQIVIGF